MGRPSKYPEEFRREAVALYRSSDRSRAEVAKSLGISDGSLAAWAKAAAPDRQAPRRLNATVPFHIGMHPSPVLLAGPSRGSLREPAQADADRQVLPFSTITNRSRGAVVFEERLHTHGRRLRR
jgi:transposase-like protein